MKKIILIIIFICGLILISLYIKVYRIGPKNAYNNGGEYVNACKSLVNKEFNLENLSILNGYTYDRDDPSYKLVEVSDTQINRYLNSEEARKVWFPVYKEDFNKGPNINYSWRCVIVINDNNLIIDTKEDFYYSDDNKMLFFFSY